MMASSSSGEKRDRPSRHSTFFSHALPASLSLSTLSGPYTDHLSLAHVFSYRILDFRSFGSWMTALSHFGAAVACAVAVAALVERAKKCLDFASTAYALHFVACCAVAGFPRGGGWWLVNAGGFAAAALSSELVCLQREMADIPLGQALRRAAAAAAQGGAAGLAAAKAAATGGGGGGGGSGNNGPVELSSVSASPGPGSSSTTTATATTMATPGSGNRGRSLLPV